MTVTVDYFDNNSEEDNLVNRERSKRTYTDLHHLFLFGMSFTLWIGIAIYAYQVGHQPNDFIPKKDFDEFIRRLFSRLSECRNVCASFIWLAVLFLGLYFIVMRFLTKLVIYTTIVLMFLLLIALCLLVTIQKIVLGLFIPIFIISFLSYGLTLYILTKVGCKTICIIIQDSCKAMTCLPSGIVAVTIYYILIELVGLFTLSVIFGLLTIQKEPNFPPPRGNNIDPPNYVFFLLFIFAIISVWIMTIIYNVGQMTLYSIFSTWYRATDKKMIPRTIIFRATYINIRYHMGTLTFGSTIFTVIQIIRTIYSNRMNLFEKFKAKPITIYCFLIVLANAISNTFVACVSYGTGFYRSMQVSFKLLMQNPLKFTAARQITEWIIFFGAVFIPVLTILLTFLYVESNPNNYSPEVIALSIGIIEFISVTVTMIFLHTFYAATTAILFCILEDLSSQRTQIENDVGENVTVPTTLSN